jgi:hypothetical protein
MNKGYLYINYSFFADCIYNLKVHNFMDFHNHHSKGKGRFETFQIFLSPPALRTAHNNIKTVKAMRSSAVTIGYTRPTVID